MLHVSYFIFFFFNDTATTEIYTLSLHDALPISSRVEPEASASDAVKPRELAVRARADHDDGSQGQDAAALRREDHRSEEHTSELQSRQYLVCRLLLEKKKKIHYKYHTHVVI